MASMFVLLLILSVVCFTAGTQNYFSKPISPFSSLSPTGSPSSWPSPSGRFAFGFYRQGRGYAVGIWLVWKHSNTVVWTANRDDPPVSENSTLALTNDGKLLLRTEQREEKIIANIAEAASFASMLDSGNFVLYNKHNDVLWESFKHPTDTILGGQKLFSGGQLVSSSSESNRCSGRFHLKMQDDGNLVLYPMGTGDTPGDAYWDTETSGLVSKVDLYLNDTAGTLVIVNRTGLDIIWQNPDDYTPVSAAKSQAPLSDNQNNNTIYRATLDIDGVFRLYSHVYNGTAELKPTTVWQALKNPCEVKSFCGFNSFCTFNDEEPYCQCLPGFEFVDPYQGSLGCQRNYTDGCKDSKENAFRFNISRMENMVWGDRAYIEEQMSEEECSTSCLKDCNCGGALFQGQTCKKQRPPLRYVRRIPPGSSDEKSAPTAFLKVGTAVGDGGNTSDPTPQVTTEFRSQKAIVVILLLTFGLIIVSCVPLIISGYFVYKFRVLRYKRLLQNGNEGLTEELTLQLFSYNELKRATNGFKEELGKGSFGAVYRGTLFKGKKLIAVKRLEKLVEEGEREFRAEMRAIGRTHHRNLVRLLGYCAMNSKRLLVYEYMSNGSLADLLFKSRMRPDWNERMRISLDIARGILYLHEGCETPIIHCDIKPQNILMDDFWTAKISDFGLAKLLMPDQTRTFTGVRGTRGYLAPEWQKNTPISVKADIYSYGIVLLEIVCCRKNMEVNISKPEEIVLSNWVYKCFAARKMHKLVVGEEVDTKILDKLVKVALWCIQEEPAFRPSMKSVVLMLEGITEISIPPCPTSMST